MNDNRKRRKIDSIIIDDSDVVKFKEEITHYLLDEKNDINANDIDSNEERVIKQLSIWLRRTYSYDALCQLLTAEDIRENTLDVDMYWLLHMTCTLHFSDFIVAIDDDRLIEFIRNNMDSYLESSESGMITSILASMVLFLFDITTSQNNESKELNANLKVINESHFRLNPKLSIARCLHIIEEIAIRTNMNEYSSSSKELHDAIKNTRILKKLKSNFNKERSLEIEQSLLQPTYIENNDFQKFVMILKIISRDSNGTAVIEWQIRQLCRFSSCILKNCNNFDNEALEDFELIIKDSIFATIDRELRSTSVSSLDFTFNTWLTESCKSSEITAISFILNKVIGIEDNANAVNYETINGLIRLATTAASDGVAEDSSIQWLRSVCLIQHLAYITQNYEENSNSNKMELGLKLLSNWFDSVLGPISNGKQSETDLVNLHPLTAKSFGFACLAFCEIVEMVSEECLQIMCNAVRLRKAFNKDAADSFLQIGRTQLKAFLSLRKGANASDDAKTRSVEITEERIIQWCRTLDTTGHLPVAVLQQSNMIGVNGYKILLSCMKLLIADNPAIRENCNKIVKAMSTSKNPLCSIAEASEFIADESYESKLDIILATLSVPPAHKLHIKLALQTLQSVNGLITKILNLSDNNSNGLSYLESWKSSSRQSIQSVFTTANADLRLKIAGLLITNLLQTITLLASQLHLATSQSILSKELVNQTFIYWYEWMYEAIDIFSEDIDAINCLSSIFQAYLLGDSMGIIRFPGLALFISLGREQLVEKIFEILFASFIKKVHNSDSIVRKFCGLLHAALSWTSSSFQCYYESETQISNLGDYLKAVHPLLISTYVWTYSCASTLSPLPNDFGFLLETICPIIESRMNKCGTVTLLTSPTFQTLLQWIISYRDFFRHDDLGYRMQPLLSMVMSALRSDFDVNRMKGIKVRELQAKPKYFSQDKVDANDCVYIWSILLDCVGPLFEINKTSKGHILDENTTLIVRYLIVTIANEINLYQINSWQLWMKCAKADIEKYGVHQKSSISLFLALIIINEGYFHTKFCDNNDYALWYSYLLSSRCMAVSKSINIDFHIGYSALTSLTARSSKPMTFYQIPLLLSSEVCNRIIMMGNKLQVKGISDFSILTINSFANCIVHDISRMLDANSNIDDIYLCKIDVPNNVIYSRTLGWTFLSATTTCRVDESITKSSLTRILKIYKSATNERKQKMLYFIVGLISSFILSSSYTNLITVFLEDKNEETMILPSSKMIELVSEELMSQLPDCIAADYVSKFRNIMKK